MQADDLHEQLDFPLPMFVNSSYYWSLDIQLHLLAPESGLRIWCNYCLLMWVGFVHCWDVQPSLPKWEQQGLTRNLDRASEPQPFTQGSSLPGGNYSLLVYLVTYVDQMLGAACPNTNCVSVLVYVTCWCISFIYGILVLMVQTFKVWRLRSTLFCSLVVDEDRNFVWLQIIVYSHFRNLIWIGSFFLQVALKCADLGHLSKTDAVHKHWVESLEEELFQQGDLEKKLGMPVSPLMNRDEGGITASQVRKAPLSPNNIKWNAHINHRMHNACRIVENLPF